MASAINAFAGGGSLISFPALVGLGLPSLQANATNSVALWPGSLASALGFWSRIPEVKQDLARLAAPTLIGSGIGAWLLVSTPAALFAILVPILIGIAVLLLAFQPQIKAWKPDHLSLLPAVALQFGVAIYGGYFGAGMGIMMLAVMSLAVEGDIHRHNALKNILAILINLVSSTILIVQGLVHLTAAFAVMAGAVLGGYASARYSQKVKADSLRWVVVAYGAIMVVWFALRAAG